NVGTRTKIDVASAEADQATAELARARAVADDRRAQAALCATLGQTTLTIYRLSPIDEGAPTSPTGGVDVAFAHRLELASLERRTRAAEESVRSTKAAFAPELKLQLGPSFTGAQIDSLTTNFSVTLSIALPAAWNAVALVGQMRQARAN